MRPGAQNGAGIVRVAHAGTLTDGLPATSQLLYYPYSATCDGIGGLYIGKRLSLAASHVLIFPLSSLVASPPRVRSADSSNSGVRYVSPTGIMVTVAGSLIGGVLAPSGSSYSVGGNITGARLNNPMGVMSDDAGGAFVSDYWNGAIHRVTASGRFFNYISGVGNPAFMTRGERRVGKTAPHA